MKQFACVLYQTYNDQAKFRIFLKGPGHLRSSYCYKSYVHLLAYSC